MPEFLQDLWIRLNSPQTFEALTRVVFILLVGLVVLKILDSALKRLRSMVPPGDMVGATRVEQRAETLRHIVRSFGKVLLAVILLFAVAREIGFDLGALLATAGVAGLAIGFGAQSLVKDVIAGFFILLEDQYGVGDAVKIGSLDGVVERMTLRVTVLRNFEGHVHVVPNGSIETVTVMTKDWGRAVVDITIPHKEELHRVLPILNKIGAVLASEMPDRMLEKPQVLGVERLSEDGVTIRMVVKTPPTKQAEVMREWRQRIKDAFDREGIDLPQKNLMAARDLEPRK